MVIINLTENERKLILEHINPTTDRTPVAMSAFKKLTKGMSKSKKQRLGEDVSYILAYKKKQW